MKTVEDTRRELFQSLNDGEYLGFYGGKYDDPIIEAKWQGFNAALDAVEIELPDRNTEIDEYDGRQTWDDCRAAIESTNLGINVK